MTVYYIIGPCLLYLSERLPAASRSRYSDPQPDIKLRQYIRGLHWVPPLRDWAAIQKRLRKILFESGGMDNIRRA